MKTILITGGSSGLGFELAKVYSDKDVRLILVGRNENKLIIAADKLKLKSDEVEIIPCDISDKFSVEALASYIQEQGWGIDKLINCAGIGFFGPFSEITSGHIDGMIDINVKGTIQVTLGLLPHIKGGIINIISTAGLKGKVNEAVYVASKFAVRGFTESLQKEYEKSHLAITAVYMGGMNTPFWDDTEHIKEKSRLKSPEDVAKEIKDKDDGRAEIHIGK